MKRAFLVHGWDGKPDEGWLPWLKTELEKRGFVVAVPAMPHPERPTIEDWVGTLSQVVGKPDADTYFVGHSTGCQAILRYLATLPEGAGVGGAVFVGGYLTIQNLETEEERHIVGEWINTPPDFEKIKKVCSKIIAIFSPTDRWVPIENEKIFQQKLSAKTMMVDGKGEKGHFTASDGVVELPEAFNAVLELAMPKPISIDDFAKVHIKMGKILTAERIEGSDKLLKLSIDLGEGSPRTICSGIAQYYQPEEVISKMVPVITNLAPRKMRGIESNGMVLFGIDETVAGLPSGALAKLGHIPVMLNPQKDLPAGSSVQ